MEAVCAVGSEGYGEEKVSRRIDVLESHSMSKRRPRLYLHAITFACNCL